MNLHPQILSFGTYLAVCAFIYKLFEKGDDLINDDAKRQLKGWILNLKTPEKMHNWPTLFAHWFDRIFGEKHLSWKCFFRSCLASLAAVLLVTLVWAALRPQELRLILSGFWLAPSELGLIQKILLYFVALNLLPDYVSLLETRYIIKLMGKRSSFVWHIMLLLLDAIVTLFIAAALPLILAFFSFSFVSSEPISLQTYLSEVLPLTGNSLIFRGVGAPFLAICFYTAFLTSVWIWLYALSGFLLKVLALWEFTKGKVKLGEKPLTYLGAMAIIMVTVGYLCITVLPASGDGPVADRKNFDDLRPVGMELSREDAAKMIASYDYYDFLMNIRGKGVENDFALLPGDSVVHDSTTGLSWQQSGSSEWLTFKQAQTYIDSLNVARYGGYTNWRLPTLEEGMSLMEPKRESGLFVDPVFDRRQEWIWTADKESASRAWYVYFGSGNLGHRYIENDYRLFCVRAVR